MQRPLSVNFSVLSLKVYFALADRMKISVVLKFMNN